MQVFINPLFTYINMRLIPLTSDAAAEILTKPFAGKTAPFAGEIIFISGGVVSRGSTLYCAEAVFV